MEISIIGPFVVAVITGLTSSAAWQYYTKRISVKDRREDRREEDERRHINLFQDTLRERVAVLEEKLEESFKEREEMMCKFIKLSESTAAMRVEIDFLRKENESLRKQLKTASSHTN